MCHECFTGFVVANVHFTALIWADIPGILRISTIIIALLAAISPVTVLFADVDVLFVLVTALRGLILVVRRVEACIRVAILEELGDHIVSIEAGCAFVIPVLRVIVTAVANEWSFSWAFLPCELVAVAVHIAALTHVAFHCRELVTTEVIASLAIAVLNLVLIVANNDRFIALLSLVPFFKLIPAILHWALLVWTDVKIWTAELAVSAWLSVDLTVVDLSVIGVDAFSGFIVVAIGVFTLLHLAFPTYWLECIFTIEANCAVFFAEVLCAFRI